MPGQVITIRYSDKCPDGYVSIDATSRSADWTKGLSPFHVGPCPTAFPNMRAWRMENTWQFSKVYEEHETDGKPNAAWYEWAIAGYADKRAHRYPAGKGRKPLYSWWRGEKLDYIQARKKIYIPVYAEAVAKGNAYWYLLAMYQNGVDIAIRDFDVYRNDIMEMTFTEVIECDSMKMGHGFVLVMMLTGFIPNYDTIKNI